MLLNSLEFMDAEDNEEETMSLSLAADFDNPTGSDVRLLKYDVVIYDEEGASVGSSYDNWEPCKIAPGGMIEMNAWCGVPAAFLENEGQGVKAGVYASLFARTVHRLGEMDIPEGPGAIGRLNAAIDTPLLDPEARIVVARSAPSREGMSRIDVRCALSNTSANVIERVTLKCEIVDDEGLTAVVEESYVSVGTSAPGVIEIALWAQDGVLHGAKLKLALAVYREVHRYRAGIVHQG